MSFLYPRSISIARQTGTSTAGAQPFQDVTAPNLTALATDVACSIQEYRQSEKPLGAVALDARARSNWTIFVPSFAAAAAGSGGAGALRSKDILTDDSGSQYQVTSPAWTPLGWELKAERLEA
jgi:hypothetical protein